MVGRKHLEWWKHLKFIGREKMASEPILPAAETNGGTEAADATELYFKYFNHIFVNSAYSEEKHLMR